MSDSQLEHTQDVLAAAGLDFPLVHAPAESVPSGGPAAARRRVHVPDAEETEWARRWPSEQIWVARKRA